MKTNMKHIKLFENFITDLFKRKPVVTVEKPKATGSMFSPGLGVVDDPLSFIAEYFGETKSKYKVKGLVDRSAKYMLQPWIDLCEEFMEQHGSITGMQIVKAGIIGNFIELDPKVTPEMVKASGKTVNTIIKYIENYKK